MRPAGGIATVPCVPRRRREASAQKCERRWIPRGCVEMVAIIARWTSYDGRDSDSSTWWVSTLDREAIDFFSVGDNEHHGFLRLQFVPIGRLSDREFYDEWEYVSDLYSTHLWAYVLLQS